MFIGHFGLSFAAKRAAPKVSLGTLFFATQFVDILWPALIFLNVEKVAITPGYTKTNDYDFLYYPYTHSLFMGVVWGVVVGLIYWLIRRDSRGSVVVGLCVLSHWFIDLIVHAADLPLTPFSDYKVGLGLWNHFAMAMTLELIIFLAGIYLYATFTKPRNRAGKWGLWTLAVLLLLLYLSTSFGPPPSYSPMTLLVSSTIMMAIIIWLAWWVDRNREI